MSRRAAWALALALSLAAIAVATLAAWPEPANPSPPRWFGSARFSLADLLRNVALFAPAGAAAAGFGLRPARVALAGLALSGTLELLQLGIPGRNPSPTDLAANALGAALGALAVARADAWLRPTPARARGMALAALALVLAACTLGGLLLRPAPTGRPFFGHWTPAALGHLEPYAGRLRDARLGGLPVPHGALEATPALREALAGEFRLRVEGRAGPPPAGQAALLMLSDADRQEILLLGPEGRDLVFRIRTLGYALGLESFQVRWTDAFANLRAGDELRVEVRRVALHPVGADWCLTMNAEERCGLGPDVTAGWTLLAPQPRALEPLRGGLGAVWLLLLLAPLGFAASPRGPGLVLWLVALAALVALPPLAGLRPTGAAALASALLALAAGHGLRRLAARRGGEARA